jgi:hypothetical protein
MLHQFELTGRVDGLTTVRAFTARITEVGTVRLPETLMDERFIDRWRSTVTSETTTFISVLFLPVQLLVIGQMFFDMSGFLPVFRTGVVSAATAYAISVVSGRRVMLFETRDAVSARDALCIYLQTLRALAMVCKAQLTTQHVIDTIALSDFVAHHWHDGTVQVRMQLACEGFTFIHEASTSSSLQDVASELLAAISECTGRLGGKQVASILRPSSDMGPRDYLVTMIENIAALLNHRDFVVVEGEMSLGEWASHRRFTPARFRSL